MSKCQTCWRKATIETVDGLYCDDHLPNIFCRGCGELVASIIWHEEHVAEFGVCGNCVDKVWSSTRKSSTLDTSSFFTKSIELMSDIGEFNMAKTVKSVKVPGLKTMSKDEQILRYASESRRFSQEAAGLSAVLYLLVDELAKQPQFDSIREQIEKHLTDNKPTLAARLIQKQLAERFSQSSVVIPGEAVTYGGTIPEQWLKSKPSSSVVIPGFESDFLEKKPSENQKTESSVVIPDPDFEPITY